MIPHDPHKAEEECRSVDAQKPKHDPTTPEGRAALFHPAIARKLADFDYAQLPPFLQAVSKPFHALAHEMAMALPSDPETTVCLRKLCESKDCAVRAAAYEAKNPKKTS